MYLHEFDTKRWGKITRVDKRKAREAYNAGRVVLIQSSNFLPENQLQPAIEASNCSLNYEDGNAPSFDDLVFEYELFNCLNRETGRFASFYLQPLWYENITTEQIEDALMTRLHGSGWNGDWEVTPNYYGTYHACIAYDIYGEYGYLEATITVHLRLTQDLHLRSPRGVLFSAPDNIRQRFIRGAEDYWIETAVDALALIRDDFNPPSATVALDTVEAR